MIITDYCKIITGAYYAKHYRDGKTAGRFDADETAKARGLFHQIEDCYLLAYLCRVPG